MTTNRSQLAEELQYWRKRARETRALVDGLHEREAKDMMLRVAREYEELAKLTEQRLKG
jgi:hypothetical protein